MADCPFRVHLANLEAEYSRLEAENNSLRNELGNVFGLCSKGFSPHDAEITYSAPVLQQDQFHRASPLEQQPRSLSNLEQAMETRVSNNSHRFHDSSWNLDIDAMTNSHRLRSAMRRPFVKLGLVDEDAGQLSARLFAFADAEEMKKRLRATLAKKPYNVTDFYQETGLARRIAVHPVFDMTTFFVIFANAIWISIETDYNDADLVMDAALGFQIVEHFFCIFFTLELGVRLAAFKVKRNCLYDMPFVFDAILVVFMIGETWGMILVATLFDATNSSQRLHLDSVSIIRVARLLRLLRMARMARLVRATPELMILIKGMVAAVRSVVFTLILLLTLLYVFGIAFTQALEQTNAGKIYFSSVPVSMNTLWLYATLFDGVTKLTHALEKEGLWAVVLLDVFILIASLTVMNMLIGVLCEVVSAVASAEKEELNFHYVRGKVLNTFKQIVSEADTDNNGMISKDEFGQILENREAATAISELGVDVIELVDMVNLIFRSEDGTPMAEIPVHRFMDTIMQFQGKNTATVKDIMQLRQFIREEFKQISSQGLTQSARLPDRSLRSLHNLMFV